MYVLTCTCTCVLLQRYVQTDIRGYSPAPGDLAYPDKLVVAAQAAAVEVGLEGTPDTTDSDSVFEASGTEVGGAVAVHVCKDMHVHVHRPVNYM